VQTAAPSAETGSPPVAETVLATVAGGRGGLRIAAVDAAARAGGVRPGMALADARALCPALAAEPADPPADRRALSALADWCRRYTPWTAVDPDTSHPGEYGGGAGLLLDASGCAHLVGGEEALLGDLVGNLKSLGFTARAAVAGSIGAAWAIARFASAAAAVVPDGGVAEALAPLPVAGLRLPPDLSAALHRVGLRRIGDLPPLPRGPLAARFGEALLRRLDQATGRLDEPLSPRMPQPALLARLAFAEPIGRSEDVARALDYLLVDLCARLQAAGLGARRLELAAFRTDGTVVRAAIGTSRPTRAPPHLRRLFREALEQIDAGFGIEAATLSALVVDPLAPTQAALDPQRRSGNAESLAELIDRLGNRLGGTAVVRLTPHPSHVPERACWEVPATTGLPTPLTPPLPRRREKEDFPGGGCPVDRAEKPRLRAGKKAEAPAGGEEHRSRQPRPLHLLATPEPIEVIAPVPDGPPVLFRWRRTRYLIARAEGPERIGPEWWLTDGGHGAESLSRIRDYYRAEDTCGLRFWIYREGVYRPDRPPRWYLHGVFG
jgi:protein ImuB